MAYMTWAESVKVNYYLAESVALGDVLRREAGTMTHDVGIYEFAREVADGLAAGESRPWRHRQIDLQREYRVWYGAAEDVYAKWRRGDYAAHIQRSLASLAQEINHEAG